MALTSLILHHYPQSPVAHKVRLALAIEQSGQPARLFPDQTFGMAMMISAWAETTLFDLAVRIVLTNALGQVPAIRHYHHNADRCRYWRRYND